MSTAYTCTACLESLAGPHLLIDSNPLCHDCFRHLFPLALDSESSYPASWAGHPLSAARYAHILGPDLLHDYQAKASEYACPAQERVFCSRTDPPRHPEACGKFVGRWREIKTCVRCEACMWYTCLRCEESFSTDDFAGTEVQIEHECDPRRDQELEERAFKGLQKGKDYQVCPNQACKRRVELSDGCNHVRCVCRTHFCFVCGGFVKDGKGHWRKKTGCPRFGQKDDERAIYDEEDAWDDNGDVDDDERARAMQRAEDREEAALRRAFEVQMRMVEEMRRELEATEAMRLENRERNSEGGGSSDKQEHRRRRRRRPRESRELDDERRPGDPQHGQRRANSPLIPSNAINERQPRRHRGLREILHNAIDATEQALFGETLTRRV